MGDGQLHVVEIAAVLRELTARLTTSDDLEEALRALACTTAQAIPGRAWSAITLIRAGAPSTAATSEGLPVDLEGAQYETGDGPSMRAIREREMVICPDLLDEPRWGPWRKRALAAGIRGALSVPLDIDDQVIGALNVYATRPWIFTSEIQFTTMLIAEHAGLLLAAVLDRGRLAGLTAELTAALADGETVNRAIGIVMAQRGCPAEDALAVLREASSTLHAPLHEVADRLVSAISSRAH